MKYRDIKTVLFKGIIQGLVWGVLYYYIRKGLNPSNYYEKRKAIEERQQIGKGDKSDFLGDAIYGGLAAIFIYIAVKMLYAYFDLKD